MRSYLLALLLTGWIAFYGPGWGEMETILAKRIKWGHVKPCPECIGNIATPNRADMGKKAWLKGPRGWEGPFLVVDCVAAGDRKMMLENQRIAEVPYSWALTWEMQGTIPGEITFTDPFPSMEEDQLWSSSTASRR